MEPRLEVHCALHTAHYTQHESPFSTIYSFAADVARLRLTASVVRRQGSESCQARPCLLRTDDVYLLNLFNPIPNPNPMPHDPRRYFMTATLAPRMNVDNGLHIFKYNGAGPVCSYSCSDLAHSCTWIPAPAAGPGSFENRPPSPNSRCVKVQHPLLYTTLL